MSDNTIHDVVRNRYGAIARAAVDSKDDSKAQAVSCCSPSATISGESVSCCSAEGCGTSAGLYNMELLEGLPVDVTNLSLGCEGTQFTRSNTACCTV